MPACLTNFYWVRHAPMEVTGCYTGQTDLPALLPHNCEITKPLSMDVQWISSPLLRACRTAEWLQKQWQCTAPITSESRLMEQSFGAWEGQSYDAIWKRHQHDCDWENPATLRPPQGESFEDVLRRVHAWIGQALQQGGNYIVVSHAGPIRAALAHAHKLTPAQALAREVPCLSVTQLRYASKAYHAS